MIVVMLISLYTTRVLLVSLGVDDYGLYNVVGGFVSMFGFLNTSMANGTQRFYNYEIGSNGKNGISAIFTHALVIQFLLALVVIIVTESIGLWYLNTKMVIPDGKYVAANWLFQFSVISMCLVIIRVPFSAAIMAYEKMHFFAIVSIIDAVLKLVIVLVLPFLPNDRIIWYGGLIALISLFNFLFDYMFCKIKFDAIKIHKGLNKQVFVSMLSFSGWNVFGSFAHMFRGQGVNLVFNFFWGTVVNAANGIAGQVSAAVDSLTAGFLTAVRPQMIKSYAAGDKEFTIKMTYAVSKLTFFLVMILAVPLIFEIPTVLDIWLGQGTYPQVTKSMCQLTIFMSLCNSFATPISILVHASGKMRKFQVICSLVILSVVPITFLSSYLGGSVELALIIAIIIVVITQIVRLFLVREIVDFSIMEYFRKVLVPTCIVFLLTAFFTFITHILLPKVFWCSILVMLVSVFLSCLFIFFIGLDKSEKDFAKLFLMRFKPVRNKN